MLFVEQGFLKLGGPLSAPLIGHLQILVLPLGARDTGRVRLFWSGRVEVTMGEGRKWLRFPCTKAAGCLVFCVEVCAVSGPE